MSAEVETMFYVRETPWHGLGTRVEEALTSAEALQIAGLDWEVKSKPVYVGGKKAEGWVANVRSSDDSVLGIVTGKYKILQNKEAFDFTDSLIGGEVKYETAGSLFNGKKIWLLARLPSIKVAGDDVDNYVCFTNSHDGKASVKACITPVRVVCNNTLNMALGSAKRSFSVRHFAKVADKVQEAREILNLSEVYFQNLAKTADDMANVTVSTEYFDKLMEKLFPIKEDASDATKKHAEMAREQFQICYLAPDIAKFYGTAWGIINATSDFVGHATPARNTSTYEERRWDKIMDGHPIFDSVVSDMTTLTYANANN